MLTKALWYHFKANQHSGMVHEKHKGLNLRKTKNNISTFV